MKKIPTIFERDWNGDRSLVTREPNPLCDWVFSGEGFPTRKIDGTSCLIRDGKLYRRRELKSGQKEPSGFELADHDNETGKTVGWIPISDVPEDKYHREAFARLGPVYDDGTYELVGPNIQGNPECMAYNQLIAHSSLGIQGGPSRDFDGIKIWLSGQDIEGVVFHHLDGRMAKIKLRDFGLKRPNDKERR